MKSDADIANKIADTFTQLFYGDHRPGDLLPDRADQAYIQDILHNKEIRTEGMGLGMMICRAARQARGVRSVVDVRAARRSNAEDGPGRGYFQSRCDTPTATEPCDDPYGEQQMVTALIFAHDRWGSTTDDRLRDRARWSC